MAQLYVAVGGSMPSGSTAASASDLLLPGVRLRPAVSARVVSPRSGSTPAVQEVTMQLPPGVGASVPIRIVAIRSTAPSLALTSFGDAVLSGNDLQNVLAVSDPVNDGAASSSFAYNSPIVEGVLVTQASPAEVLAARQNGAIPVGVLPEQVRVITIIGRSFGSSPDGGAAAANGTGVWQEPQGAVGRALLLFDYDAADISTATPLVVAAASRLTGDDASRGGASTSDAVLEWSHDRIRMVTLLARGKLAVRTSTMNPFTRSVDAAVSDATTFESLAPQVDGLVGPGGDANYRFPTRGGISDINDLATHLHMSVDRLSASDSSIEVQVGGKECPVLSCQHATGATEGDCTIVQPSDVPAQVVAPQLTGGSGPSVSDPVDIVCAMPAGQGRQVPVNVLRNGDGSVGVGGTQPIISYRPPTVSDVGAARASGDSVRPEDFLPPIGIVVGAGPDDTGARLRVPTLGGKVRFEGENLGACPVVEAGDGHTFAFCEPDGSGGERLKSTGGFAIAADHSWAEFDMDAGEGDGLGALYARSPGVPETVGFTISLHHGATDVDEGAGPYRFGYRQPVVSGIQVLAPGPVTQLSVLGADFGVATRPGHPLPEVELVRSEGGRVDSAQDVVSAQAG